MSRIYRSLPPKGTRLAIAFSGGLDTRCAVAWLTEQGMEVYAYTADLAQPDEASAADLPPTALAPGAPAPRPGGGAPRRATTRTRSTSTPTSAAGSAACSTRASGTTPRPGCSGTP